MAEQEVVGLVAAAVRSPLVVEVAAASLLVVEVAAASPVVVEVAAAVAERSPLAAR